MAKDLQEDSDKDYIRLHIGGLSSDVTEKDISDRFNSFGKILSIDVVKGYDCACRGFAYINFDKSADVKKCISILDRTRWRGNLLTIQKASADFMTRRNAELEARRKKEQEKIEKLKETQAAVEENAASKDKNGLWVVNKHGLVLPVLRITNNNGKVVKINPNKYKNAVKRLAADSSGEEEHHFSDDEVGEAPKKVSEEIEIIPEDQMEVDEEEIPASKADIAYPFSDDEEDGKYESRGEDDDAPVVVPANVQKEKKSALSILEQMFPEEKEFIRKKDAKMEKARAIGLKETGPVGPGVKEALAKIEAKKAAEKAASAAATKQVTKAEPVKEAKAKEPEKKTVPEPTKELVKAKEVEKKPVVEAAKETKPKEAEKKQAVEPVKETKTKEAEKKQVVEPVKETKTKEAEKKQVVEPVKETKAKEVVVEKKSEPAPQPTIVNTKKRGREESSSSSSSDDEKDDGDDSSSTTSSASSSTEFFESIKRRKIMESAQQKEKQAAPEKAKAKPEDKNKAKPVAQEQPKAQPKVEETKNVVEKEESSSSSSSDEEDDGNDSDSDSSSTTSSASSSTEFFEEIRRRKQLEQQKKDEKQAAKDKKKAKQEPVVTKPVEPVKQAETQKVQPVAVAQPAHPLAQQALAASTDAQGMQIDEENGKSWVDIMNQYETERLKPVTILAPKAVWKLFPDRDDTATAAPMATTTSGNAMDVETTAAKPEEEKTDIGVDSKNFKPFFPFIGNGEKLIGDTLVRTKTLEEIESEWRREKVFLTQDYKKKQSIAVKKRRKLEKKQR